MEVANHLRKNLDGLHSRGLIPDESIEQRHLLELAEQVMADNASLGTTPENREYSFVFEDPTQEKQPSSQHAESRGVSQSLHQLTLSHPLSLGTKHRSTVEPMAGAGVNVARHLTTSPYGQGELPTTQTPPYTSNAYVPSQSAEAQVPDDRLASFELNYFHMSADQQLYQQQVDQMQMQIEVQAGAQNQGFMPQYFHTNPQQHHHQYSNMMQTDRTIIPQGNFVQLGLPSTHARMSTREDGREG